MDLKLEPQARQVNPCCRSIYSLSYSEILHSWTNSFHRIFRKVRSLDPQQVQASIGVVAVIAKLSHLPQLHSAFPVGLAQAHSEFPNSVLDARRPANDPYIRPERNPHQSSRSFGTRSPLARTIALSWAPWS